jgi:hypothetical protein
MKTYTPDSFHVWLVYFAMSMLKDSHHITHDELVEGLDLTFRAERNNIVINQPIYKPEMTRAGTPVCDCED